MGLSLGEYSALIYSKAISFFPAEHRYMEQFCPQNNADLVISE